MNSRDKKGDVKLQLLHSMAEADQKEKEHAITANHFRQGVPFISVVADCGLLKRSHKHSYNAKVVWHLYFAWK